MPCGKKPFTPLPKPIAEPIRASDLLRVALYAHTWTKIFKQKPTISQNRMPRKTETTIRLLPLNEYIHQIWAIAYAGQEVALNTHQKAALAFMKTKNVPMKLVPNYAHKIGKTIK